MCDECTRRSLAAIYRSGRRRPRDEAFSMPCRSDDRLTDLVIRSAPVTAKKPVARKRQSAKEPTSRRREVR
jgi:hypothetical protein